MADAIESGQLLPHAHFTQFEEAVREMLANSPKRETLASYPTRLQYWAAAAAAGAMVFTGISWRSHQMLLKERFDPVTPPFNHYT